MYCCSLVNTKIDITELKDFDDADEDDITSYQLQHQSNTGIYDQLYIKL